mmetsp:Transcript_10777/g.14922  ORF Transcript_10777/g.14922 Transcript_10777/m.14922 type:complete len:83 (-) Transcript_10777:195-443(-)
MEPPNRIFSPEQIEVNPELPLILKDYSKALIRANPKNIYAFSAEYFRQKAGIDGEPIPGSNERNDDTNNLENVTAAPVASTS